MCFRHGWMDQQSFKTRGSWRNNDQQTCVFSYEWFSKSGHLFCDASHCIRSLRLCEDLKSKKRRCCSSDSSIGYWCLYSVFPHQQLKRFLPTLYVLRQWHWLHKVRLTLAILLPSPTRNSRVSSIGQYIPIIENVMFISRKSCTTVPAKYRHEEDLSDSCLGC